MKLGATITSERGKPVTKTGNGFIEIDINVERTWTYRLTINQFGLNLRNILTGETLAIVKNGSLKHGKCSNCYKNNITSGLPLCENCRVRLDQ